MSDTIRYCINGCHRRNTDGEREPIRATIGHLCGPCVGRLEKWLTEIPERYALLPDYLLPSADMDANPESKATKRPVAPAPVRVAALDLLDTRLGRKWQGTEPTTDRRGALGTLLAIGNQIREHRGSPAKPDSHVLTEADYIRLSVDTLATSEGIKDTYNEIRILHRELGDAVGQYPPKPVGTCYVIPEGETNECGGPLMPNYGGVYCPRCGTRWGHDELRRVGMALSEPA